MVGKACAGAATPARAVRPNDRKVNCRLPCSTALPCVKILRYPSSNYVFTPLSLVSLFYQLPSPDSLIHPMQCVRRTLGPRPSEWMCGHPPPRAVRRRRTGVVRICLARCRPRPRGWCEPCMLEVKR